PHHGHEREHVVIHAQHYEQDKSGGRIWLVGGIALLAVAVVYSAVLITHSRAKAASGSNLELAQMQFDASRDTLGMTSGSDKAAVAVREFADFQCPACGGFEPIMA